MKESCLLLRSIGVALLLALLSMAVPAAYPEKPITVVVAFPAGGGGDIGVRQTLNAVTAKIGLNFIVDNRAGAGGLIGASYAAKAAPDVYTLFHGTATTVLTAHLHEEPVAPRELEVLAPLGVVLGDHQVHPAVLDVGHGRTASGLEHLHQYM